MQDNAGNTEAQNVVHDSKFLFPSWFHEGCSREDIFFGRQPVALSHLLNGSRRDMYAALSLYQTHVKYASTVVLSLVTVVAAIFSVLKATNHDVGRTIEVGAGVLLLVACAIGFLFVFVVTRYYNVYVSALLYAAQIHFAAGMAGFRWFERILEDLHREYAKNSDDLPPQRIPLLKSLPQSK